MKFLSARGILPACIVSAATVAALVAPGAANAALLTKCEGGNIGAAGSSLQAEAQIKVWNIKFNTAPSTVLTACSGSQGSGAKPVVTYTSTSSGKGFEAWNVKEEFGNDAFIGTDNTVNSVEKGELEAKGTKAAGGKVLTVPVLQGAVAVIINLPEGCEGASTAALHRLTLNQSTLEGIFAGTVTEWSSITDDGDKIVQKAPVKVAKVATTEGSAVVTVVSKGFPGVRKGTTVTGTGIPAGTTVLSISGNSLTLSQAATKTVASDTLTFTFPVCNPNTPITTVVREDGSGTTHIFKRFLHWSNEGELTTASGNFTWNQLSEGTKCGGVSCSTLWPTGVGATKGAKGEGLVKKVAETPGSIGYANLADARNVEYGGYFAPPLGGEKTQSFWAELENGPGTYADPSSNKDTEKRASANCKSTEYSNGLASFPPPSVESTWNEVTTKQFSKTYAICGLTYDLVLSNYKAYPGTTQGEATTVENYLAYMIDTKGGQKEVVNNDYLALTSVILAKSKEALPLINWL
ncbi:MAG TPA: substrate-binding domain-containing protein [Solirubrobacteraceae bacterium]|jgi:ABC-type phosphate transport system substrate-binding protein|nr:substrate-binding domain-containing protein [Solirubrobacteraceae bacterium]